MPDWTNIRKQYFAAFKKILWVWYGDCGQCAIILFSFKCQALLVFNEMFLHQALENKCITYFYLQNLKTELDSYLIMFYIVVKSLLIYYFECNLYTRWVTENLIYQKPYLKINCTFQLQVSYSKESLIKVICWSLFFFGDWILHRRMLCHLYR